MDVRALRCAARPRAYGCSSVSHAGAARCDGTFTSACAGTHGIGGNDTYDDMSSTVSTSETKSTSEARSTEVPTAILATTGQGFRNVESAQRAAPTVVATERGVLPVVILRCLAERGAPSTQITQTFHPDHPDIPDQHRPCTVTSGRRAPRNAAFPPDLASEPRHRG